MPGSRSCCIAGCDQPCVKSQRWCKEHRADRTRQYKLERPTTQRNATLRAQYGISLAEYEALLLKQKGVCAICSEPEKMLVSGRPRYLSIDHCHKTNAIRGLLCYSCNTLLAKAEDSVAILLKAVEYLQEHATGLKASGTRAISGVSATALLEELKVL